MKRSGVRLRFWMEIAVAVLGAGLLGLTLVYPEWIETVFGIEPDQGSGVLEMAIAVALLLLAATSAVIARAEWRRTSTS